MWQMRSNTLVPLTRMAPNKRKFKWTKVKQDSFDKIKWIVAHDTLLTYTDFNKMFKTHTDARYFQLGVLIRQKDKPTAFYSIKRTEDQQRYTVTERELLSITENIKDFRTILLVHKIIVYTGH